MVTRLKTTRHAIALVLCVAIAATGCAASGARGVTVAPGAHRQTANRAVLAEYVLRLPVGSAIRVQRVGGDSIRGTLMKATDQDLVIQPRTRVPEPPVEIALADVVAVTPDSNGGHNLAKAIGIGAAAGAGAALAVFFIIVALYAD